MSPEIVNEQTIYYRIFIVTYLMQHVNSLKLESLERHSTPDITDQLLCPSNLLRFGYTNLERFKRHRLKSVSSEYYALGFVAASSLL